MERIVFLTGRLAQASLERVLASMDAPFSWEVREIGLQVAALMTADLIQRRVAAPVECFCFSSSIVEELSRDSILNHIRALGY